MFNNKLIKSCVLGLLLLIATTSAIAATGTVVRVLSGGSVSISVDSVVKTYTVSSLIVPNDNDNNFDMFVKTKCHLTDNAILMFSYLSKLAVMSRYRVGSDIEVTNINNVVRIPDMEELLIKKGYAMLYSDFKGSGMVRLQFLEDTARKHKRGLWAYKGCWR